MPKVREEIPGHLQVYHFYGVYFETQVRNKKNATTDCCFCGSEKFGINIEDGRFHCFSCDIKGNHHSFTQILLEKSQEATTQNDYEELAEDRKLLNWETLQQWGLAKSLVTQEWIVPTYSLEGKDTKLEILYRYCTSGEKRLLIPPANSNHQLHGLHLFDPTRSKVYLCEGPWDAMALWETLSGLKTSKEGYIPTSNPELSLIKDINILAVPGCKVFNDQWADLLKDKEVYILYDNDHPREHPKTGETIPPAGYSGMKKVGTYLGSLNGTAPKSINCLLWGDKGYDGSLPSGTDIRDCLANGDTFRKRGKELQKILQRLTPLPESWYEEEGVKKQARSIDGMVYPVPCDNWKSLVNEWRKALKWTEGLDRGLSVMLAANLSTKISGEQLWIKVISPPSSGKSTLCEALAVARQYVYSLSTFRGFFSGASEKGSDEDFSLITMLDGKSLLVKDADPLINSPNLPQILSEARDIYDRVSRVSYRNKIKTREYKKDITVMFCGTSAIRQLDHSELGQRFLDCVLMEEIPASFEVEINRKKMAQLREAMVLGASNRETDTEAMIRAKQLTGGYIEYLRSRDRKLLSEVQMSDLVSEECIQLGTFVAYMRSRPSKKQEEEATRELSTRLVSQHGKLAYCLAVVLNKKVIDEEVMRRVRQVALDTARGRTLDICKQLFRVGEEGATSASLVSWTYETEITLRQIMRFLKRIKVVENFVGRDKITKTSRSRWRLTPHMRILYDTVLANIEILLPDEEVS